MTKNTTTPRSMLLPVVALSSLLGIYVIVALAAPHSVSDEGAYVAFAEHLTQGFYSGRGDNVELWFGPGLPVLLAPFVALGLPIEALRLLGALLLIGAIWLFYMLLKHSTGPRFALGGALGLGLYWPALRLLPTLHSEIPAMLFVVAFMGALALDVRRPRATTLFAAAASLALLAVTRVVFGWILVGVIVVGGIVLIARRSVLPVRRLVAAAAVALVLALPWLAYTYAVTGKSFYWATSGGLSLYWMSSPHPGDLGDWHSSQEAISTPDLAPHRSFFEGLRGLNEVESDEALKAQAIRQIRDNPDVYAKNIAANLSRMFFSTPFSFTQQKLSTAFYLVPNAFLLGLFAAAMVALALRGRWPPEALPFGIVLLVGVIGQAFLSAYSRMVVPLVPIVLWFVVQAAFVIFGDLERRKAFRTESEPPSSTA